MVDTSNELIWIEHRRLAEIGIEPQKLDCRFVRTKRPALPRSIGFVIIRVGTACTTDEVEFAQQDDLPLLGARTLEGLNLTVDSRGKQLVTADPVVAAGNMPRIGIRRPPDA